MTAEINRSTTPLYAWIILAISIVAVSSAGAVFQMMSSVPPLLRASWRLQATSMILFPFAMYQYYNLEPEIKKLTFEIKNLLIILGSGICLWLHFGSWVWSLDHTTLPRSLLFVTSHPLVIVLGLWIIKKPVNRKSSAGAIIGFIGASIIILGVNSEGNASLMGDLAAFFGAVTVVGYFTAGRILREWMPLFIYALPVTFLAAIFLGMSSIIQEGVTFFDSTPENSIFGWFNGKWIILVAYLAIGPGLIGHTGINGVLKWISPFLISIFLVFEPLIGSLIGYFFVSKTTPGIETLIGGFILIAGTLMVTTSQHELLDSEGE